MDKERKAIIHFYILYNMIYLFLFFIYINKNTYILY